MSRTLKVLVVFVGFLIASMAVAYIKGWFANEVKPAPISYKQDLSDHPVYSKYSFGSTHKNVIDIGIQPLWIPTSIITEVMRRDTVLRKILAKQGFEIRFHPFLKGADVNFFLQRGDLEVAVGGDMPALTAAANSNVLVAALTQLGFCSIVAKRHMLVKELNGKRIGYAFGSNAHYALLQALSSAGLREKDVKLIPLDVNEMPEALNQGDIEAFSAWEPIPAITLSKFKGPVIIHKSLSSGYLYFSRSFAEQHFEVTKWIVASQLRAMSWMSARKENLLDACRWTLQASKDFSGKTTVLTVDQYVSLAEGDLLGISSIPAIPEEDFAPQGRLFREFQFLKALGKIPATVDWSKVRAAFDHTLISEIVSRKDKYQLDIYEYSNEGIKDNASR